MTHQFEFVPLLMIGTIASQAVTRALCQSNFYSEILERDGVDVEPYIPPRSLAALQRRQIATIAGFTPVFFTTTERSKLLAILEEHPYQIFPVVIEEKLLGVLDRTTIEQSTKDHLVPTPAYPIFPHQTIRDAITLMVKHSADLLPLISDVDGKLVGVVTLHDVLRLQNQYSEML